MIVADVHGHVFIDANVRIRAHTQHMRVCALKQPKPGADLSVRANCRADPICLSTLVGAQDSCSENEKSLDCLSSSLAFQGGEWYLCRGSSVEGVPRRK